MKRDLPVEAAEQHAEKRPEVSLELPGADEGWVDHLSAVQNVEFNQLATAISVTATATPLVLGYLFSLPPSCQSLTKASLEQMAQGTSDTKCIDDLAYIGLPLAPVSIILFYCYLFLNSRMVGKYARSLERTLASRELAASASTKANHSPNNQMLGMAGGSSLPPRRLYFPALSRLNGALYGGEAPSLIPYRLVLILFGFTLVAVQFYTIFFLLQRVHNDTLQTVASWCYSVLMMVSVGAFLAGGSHTAFADLKEAALKRDSESEGEMIDPYEWSKFVGVSLVPRVASLLKGLDGVVLVGALALLGLVTQTSAWRALGLLFFFESVLYQTRYLLNASREVADPKFALPGDLRNNSGRPWTPVQRLMVPVIVSGRVYAFYWVVTHLGLLDRHGALRVVIGFFVVFYLYEVPREVARRWHRGLTTAVDKHGKAVPDQIILESITRRLQSGRFRVLGVLLWIAVGAGYALRWAVVLFVANQALLLSLPGALIVIGAGAIGCSQVAAGWVVESYGALGHGGRVSAGILAKPHLAWAARHFGEEPAGGWRAVILDLKDSRKDERIEAGSSGWGRLAPWTASMLVALASVTAALALLLPGEPWTLLVSFVLGFGACAVGWYAASALALRATPRARLLAFVVVALGASYVMHINRAPTGVVGAGILLLLPMAKLAMSQGGLFDSVLEQAEQVRAWVRTQFRRLGGAVIATFEFIFGYPFVHAFRERFIGRRRSWL